MRALVGVILTMGLLQALLLLIYDYSVFLTHIPILLLALGALLLTQALVHSILFSSSRIRFFFFFNRYLAAEAVGTVENSARFLPEFSKRGGNGGKHAVRFPRFPRRGSFHSLWSKAADFFRVAEKQLPYFPSNEFLAASAW